MAGQVPLDGLRRCVGLMDQRRARRQRGAEQVGDDLVVGAAEDGAVGRAADPARQRGHVRLDRLLERRGLVAGLDLAGEGRARLREHRDRVAALGDLDLVDPARGRGRGREDAEDVELLDLVGALLQLLVPGPPGRRLDGGDDQSQGVHRTAELGAVARQPGLLQAPQRHRRGGVAGQDHQPAALIEQPHAARAS